MAQERGQWLLGSGGLDCGSEPAPGIYYSELVTFYNANGFGIITGQEIPLDTSLTLIIDQVTLGWISNIKIFGGNYGFDLQPSISQGNLELNSGNIHPSTGFGDLNAEPIILGWSSGQFDFLAVMGLVIPTGNFGVGPVDDTGRGQWTLIPSVGSTLYFDEGRRYTVSTRILFELPVTDQRNTNFRQGSFLDVEYSVGGNFLQGLLQIGMVGYAGFQLSSGSGIESNSNVASVALTQIQGLGPQIGINVRLRSDVLLNLSLRDYFEFDAESTTQGSALFAGASLKF